jgi:hypothetical protein
MGIPSSDLPGRDTGLEGYILLVVLSHSQGAENWVTQFIPGRSYVLCTVAPECPWSFRLFYRYIRIFKKLTSHVVICPIDDGPAVEQLFPSLQDTLIWIQNCWSRPLKRGP